MNSFDVIGFNTFSKVYKSVYYEGFVLQCFKSAFFNDQADSCRNNQPHLEVKTKPAKLTYRELV